MPVIDGKDMVLGRLASFVAKELLKGRRIEIVNAERIVISGERKTIYRHYRTWMGVRTVTNPRKGPFHFRRPEDIVKRTVRGMLPYKKPKGRRAYRLLRVHRGVPERLAGKETLPVPHAGLGRLGTRRYITLESLSKHLGANL
jgi:large subunit ribosomal protein L13